MKILIGDKEYGTDKLPKWAKGYIGEFQEREEALQTKVDALEKVVDKGTKSLAPAKAIRKQLATHGALLDERSAKFVVDLYYRLQEYRKAIGNQVRTLDPGTQDMMGYFLDEFEGLEAQAQRALKGFAEANDSGKWATGILGIGPIIAAVLNAHIDIEKCPTVGHMWRFMGLDPSIEWLGKVKSNKIVADVIAGRKVLTQDDLVEISAKTNRSVKWLEDHSKYAGKLDPSTLIKALSKPPWRMELKVLAFKIGDSFRKNSGRENCLYGKVYLQRKAYETRKNEAGDYADQAAKALKNKKIDKRTDAYKAYITGKLPKGHIDARARRYAAKLFLAHYWTVRYHEHYGHNPPLPYPIAILKHTHFIPPPAWDKSDELVKDARAIMGGKGIEEQPML